MTIHLAFPALLEQAATTARDTILVRQLPPIRTPFEELVFTAGGLTSILVLVLVAMLVVALLAVRRSVQRAHATFERRLEDFGRRLDDVNSLVGRVTNQADRVADLTGSAISGVEWGADKINELRKRKRRPRRRRRDGGASPDGGSDSTPPDGE